MSSSQLHLIDPVGYVEMSDVWMNSFKSSRKDAKTTKKKFINMKKLF